MLVIESLSKSYIDAGETQQVLDQADFKLEQGHSLSIVGASGSGKSTLLHLIGALDTADSGRILLKTDNNTRYDDISTFTEEQADAYRKRQLGLIFQKFNLIDCISVYDNIALPARLNNCLDEVFIEGLLEQLGIEKLIHKLPTDLSGGEQQRVAIARALSHKPMLVLADEPTGNLDAINSEKVSRLLVNTCKQNNASLIMVTHSDEVASLTQHKMVLKKGKLEDCPTRAILKVV
jgi:putative ABC transport system ATP-binding protein